MRVLRAMPVWFKRLLFSLPNPVDLFALPKLRRICEANGVKPPKSLWREWWDSPDGVLALFPEWFAKPQLDWPTNLLQWTFPLEDLATEQPLKPELQAFLAVGERPLHATREQLAWTSAMHGIRARTQFYSAIRGRLLAEGLDDGEGKFYGRAGEPGELIPPSSSPCSDDELLLKQ